MKGLIVCRTGMGSSLMLKIKAQKSSTNTAGISNWNTTSSQAYAHGETLILSSLCAISPMKSKPPDSELSALPT